MKQSNVVQRSGMPVKSLEIVKATDKVPFSGLVYDLDSKAYFSHKAANASFLKSLNNNSPAKAKALSEVTRKPTAAMQVGTCVHTLVLEPSEFNSRYLVKELNLRTNADKEVKAEAEKNGITIIGEDEFEQAKAMRDSVMSHKEARALFTGGQSEVSMFWTDPTSGAPCKARADYFQPKKRVIADLKTCDDVSNEGISQSISKYSYHLQNAHYLMGARLITGMDEIDFIFVFVEKSPPYEVRVGRLPLDVVCFAEATLKPLLRLYQECITSGFWPGHEQKIETFELAPWKYKQLTQNDNQ
jgi:hypothetical protein